MNIRLKKEEKAKKMYCAADIYPIMQRILLSESKTDRNREHLWTISLDNARRVINIELVSLGTVTKTLIEPMEVFSIPLQKRAVNVILVHNHPSGELHPSEPDKDHTDRLIQVGRIMHVPVLDHLIITETAFMSFEDTGLLAELRLSLKYVPDYELREHYEKAAEEKGKKEGTEKGKKETAREIARIMKKEGYQTESIEKITGLSKTAISRLKTN